MTELESIIKTISGIGKVKVRSVDVRDGTESFEHRILGSLAPELVYGPKALEYTITVRVYPNDKTNQTN